MSNDVNETQVAILGGGPGGYAAAFRAADLGLDTTLIDLEKNPGGTCLYRGCIPSKALLHVAKVLSEARDAEYWGIYFDEPKVDIDRMRNSKDEVVGKMTGGLGQLCRARNVNTIQGRASFEDAHLVRITKSDGSEERLRAENIIIATGSRPARLPGLLLESDRVMTSTNALHITTIPERLLVVGGGYIGLELGTVYAALESEVTVVEMMPQLLPGCDEDLVGPLARRMEGMMSEILLETKVANMEEEGDGIEVTLEDKDGGRRKAFYDRVLVSIGRQPNSSGIGLNSIDVEPNDKGFIQIDAQRRTAAPHVFAIGDVAGEPMLAHKASHEGRVAAEVIAGEASVFEPRAIPAVVFTDPEVAWCGLTEREAKEQGADVRVERFPWSASGRATTLNRPDGLTKILTDPESGQVLGVGIAGAGAGELISEGVLAVEMGALASDIGLSIHPHPTLGETIMETADLIFGQGTHAYKPKK